MVHFLIAYLLLKYIVLRPALTLLKKRDREAFLMRSNIALLQEEVARRNAMIEAQWKRHCGVLYSRYVSTEKHRISDLGVTVLSSSVIRLDEAVARNLEEAFANSLIREILFQEKIHGNS